MRDSHAIAAKLEECLEADYFPQAIKGVYALISHIIFLEEKVSSLKDTINRLQSEGSDKDAWEGRYWALLEEAEGNRPREIDANTKAQDVPGGTIVVDRRGHPWISSEGNWWRLAKYVAFGKLNRLHPATIPHTIIYTPKGES